MGAGSNCFLIARIVAATFLLLSGILKLGGSPPGLSFLTLFAAGEMILGIWLISGQRAEVATRVTVILYLGFLCYLSVALARGWDSCGCFGAWRTPPAAVILLDAGIILALWMTFPGQRLLPVSIGSRFAYGCSLFLASLVAVALGWTASKDQLAMALPAPTGKKLVVLKPSDWVGKSLPVLSEIDIGPDLGKGDWLLVFVRHDCGHCNQLIPHYEQMAQTFSGAPGSPTVALVQLPPYGELPVDPGSAMVRGRLSDTYDWFVKSPVELLLTEGVIVNVKRPEDG
jgi:hypothetical protein